MAGAAAVVGAEDSAVELFDRASVRKLLLEVYDRSYRRGLVDGVIAGSLLGWLVGTVTTVVFLTYTGHMKARGL
jgi:hypothetical protein